MYQLKDTAELHFPLTFSQNVMSETEKNKMLLFCK